MKIDKKDFDKLAHLARLEFTDEARETMLNDMEKIVGFIDKINELDLEGVEPLVYVNEGENVLREDIMRHDITQQEALKNAPQKDTDYIKVPTVLTNKK